MYVQPYLFFEGRCEEAIELYRQALGAAQMPMGPTFFASRFGMVADRFGVSWMVIAAPES